MICLFKHVLFRSDVRLPQDQCAITYPGFSKYDTDSLRISGPQNGGSVLYQAAFYGDIPLLLHTPYICGRYLQSNFLKWPLSHHFSHQSSILVGFSLPKASILGYPHGHWLVGCFPRMAYASAGVKDSGGDSSSMEPWRRCRCCSVVFLSTAGIWCTSMEVEK